MRIKALADAKGITESEFVRMAVSAVVDREEAYFNSLLPIFAANAALGNQYRVQPCSTPTASQENADSASEIMPIGVRHG